MPDIHVEAERNVLDVEDIEPTPGLDADPSVGVELEHIDRGMGHPQDCPIGTSLLLRLSSGRG